MLFIRNVHRIFCTSLPQKVVATDVSSTFSSVDQNRQNVSERFYSVKTPIDKTTVNEAEVDKFQHQSNEWWNDSTFSALAAMNRLRVPLVRDGILNICSPLGIKSAKPLKGFTILDVGCGGGLLSEPLARLGAQVTGLDPGAETVRAAQNHAKLDSTIKDNLEYICGTVEDLSKTDKRYNAVVCSEVIEHVDNVDLFVKCCTNLVQDNGSLFFTTLNRTAFSYFFAIIMGEEVLRILPRGTHEWKKFVPPADLKHKLLSYGCRTLLIHGMFYNPLTKKWSWTSYDGGSYALHAVKETANQEKH